MREDLIHPFGDHAHWTEGFRFDFYDRARDLCGLMEIVLRPNTSTKEMFCHLMMPDGSVAGVRDSVPFDRPTLETKGLRFDMLDPEKRWEIGFIGGMDRTTERKMKRSHVELELEFDALSEVFDYRSCESWQGEHIPGRVASEHLAQVGRLRGRLSTGLDEFEIDSLGERSHSWGVTDWAAPIGRTRLACQFSETHALNVTRLATAEEIVEAGFVFQDGRNVPVIRTDLNVNADFSRNIKSFDMTLHDAEGNSHKVFGSIMKKVDVHHMSPDGKSMATVNETLARYTIAGKNGYGIAEFLQRTE